MHWIMPDRTVDMRLELPVRAKSDSGTNTIDRRGLHSPVVLHADDAVRTAAGLADDNSGKRDVYGGPIRGHVDY